MANWKKVIVSGSDAELNHITASGTFNGGIASSSISASGNWYADIPTTDDQTYVVVYDPSTGEFKYRLLSSFPGIS